MTRRNDQRIAIIGGGPAGLMAADILCSKGFGVDLYDAMPSLGRKFLMAGKSGLNLTHSERHDTFLKRFDGEHRLKPYLDAFPADAIREWADALGVETFIGSSGRVFPNEMKAAPLLRSWLRKLRSNGLNIVVRHKWMGWDEDGSLVFETPQGQILIQSPVTVLALGGASWPQLGSDGRWQDILDAKNISLAPLKPSNCGFEVEWSNHLRTSFQGHPLKGVALKVGDQTASGECVVTDYGLEGGPVYVLSKVLRDTIETDGSATLMIDLLPDLDEKTVTERLLKPRGKKSLATHLKRQLGLSGVKAALLREGIDQASFPTNPASISSRIKALPLVTIRARPIAEAISSAGGVTWASLTHSLELKSLENVYVAGEMLDWDAPTGGYLLSGCLATGRWVGEAIAEKMKPS